MQSRKESCCARELIMERNPHIRTGGLLYQPDGNRERLNYRNTVARSFKATPAMPFAACGVPVADRVHSSNTWPGAAAAAWSRPATGVSGWASIGARRVV